MTFARTVRLLFSLLLVVGFTTSRPAVYAQSRADVRQYDPAFDGAGLPADDDWGAVPAYVSAISGAAQLYRAGDVTSEFEQVPLEIGDQLRTTRGRVEVLFSDGSVVALDEYSAITVDEESVWRLHTGRVKVVSRSTEFAMDAAPVGVAHLRGSGDYRITLAANRRDEPELEVAVARGSAELENRLGRTLVRQGTRALTTETFAPSVPYAFSAPRDEFERWTESLEAERYGVESPRYLPIELRAYGGYFDRYGSWSHHHSHGWVWYPRVAVGWEPFRTGRWSFVIGFGYNWIGGSRWEWPTHHYGRWDRSGSRWYWVPSRPLYARRIGYAAPRHSVSASVSYYSRPVTTRPSTVFRSDSSRSRIVESPRDNRQPSGSYSRPQAPQPRVAIPRPSTTARETRSSTFPASPSSRQADPVYRPRQAPSPEAARVTRPERETPQYGRPAPSTREQRPTARPSTPQPPPSVERPSQTSRSSSRSAPTVGRPPAPSSSARQPSGSRTPSSSSRPASGTAVRRGGGGR